MSNALRPPIIGIDLGTTKCMVAVKLVDEKNPLILDGDRDWNTKLLPSVFCYIEDEGAVVVGRDAEEKAKDKKYRSDVITLVKRFMSRPDHEFTSGGRDFTPALISSYYLKELWQAAEEQLVPKGIYRGDITEAVITVPSYFGYLERHWTEVAGRDHAGFNNVYLLEEPIAAAIGLGLGRTPDRKLVMVVDLGGGTIDVTLLEIGGEVENGGFFELGRAGDLETGGHDWDTVVAELAAEKVSGTFVHDSNIDLYKSCEEAKKYFCDESRPYPDATVKCFDDQGEPLPDAKLNRDEFEEATADLARYCARICDELLKDLSDGALDEKGRRRSKPIRWEDIDQVYLVGGGGQVPAVRRRIEELWRQPLVARLPVNSQHIVAWGAALYADGIRHGDGQLPFHTKARSPHTIGYWYYPTPDEDTRKLAVIVRRNSVIPGEFPVGFIVGGEGSSFEFEIVEERISRHSEDDSTVEAQIGRIVLENLPDSGSNGSDKGRCTLHYPCSDNPTDNKIWLEIEYASRAQRFYLEIGASGSLEQTDEPPTVEVVDFTATSEQDGVVVRWETARELDTEGYHVWRRTQPDEESTRVTTKLIPAEGGPTERAKYSHVDSQADPREEHEFKLEEVEHSGRSTFFGPVSYAPRTG